MKRGLLDSRIRSKIGAGDDHLSRPAITDRIMRSTRSSPFLSKWKSMSLLDLAPDRVYLAAVLPRRPVSSYPHTFHPYPAPLPPPNSGQTSGQTHLLCFWACTVTRVRRASGVGRFRFCGTFPRITPATISVVSLLVLHRTHSTRCSDFPLRLTAERPSCEVAPGFTIEKNLGVVNLLHPTPECGVNCLIHEEVRLPVALPRNV